MSRLGELENIPFAVQDKICENRQKLAYGTVAAYHNLQWWQDEKNHAIHIPEGRLSEFEEAVKGGRRAKELEVFFNYRLRHLRQVVSIAA